eukprot:scaffold146803_cov17-Tisochrysis_lutea.AAC.1
MKATCKPVSRRCPATLGSHLVTLLSTRRWVQASLATLPPLLDLDAAGQPAPSVHTPAEGPGSETTAAKPVGGAAPAPAAAAAGPAAADTAADASTGA